MSEMKDSVEYDLKVPFEYSGGTCNKILISGPNFRAKNQRNYYSNLQIIINNAMMELSNKAPQTALELANMKAELEDSGKKPEAMTGDEMMRSLRFGMGLSFNKEVQNFFLHNSVHLKVVGPGEPEEFKSGMYENMNPDDCSLIFSEFVANFIWPSLIP